MSSQNRRSFLKQAATGIAATGALPLAFSDPAVALSAEAATDASERQGLIAEAHFGPKTPASSSGGMAISSHPLATREAVNILKKGGNACDAAMAASITQTVVEPHMTTITGCLCFLYYDSKTGKPISTGT